MFPKRKTLVVFFILLANSPLSFATDLRWSGFLSIAGGTTLKDDTTYQVEPTTNGAYDNEIRFDPESVVGLQAQALISDKMRATVQFVAKGANDFNTGIDWAYMSYDLTDALTLNAGRFRLPLFYYSDYIDVGYTYYWVRPPIDVYNVFTTTVEGANLYHTYNRDNFTIETQAWYGAIDQESEGTSFDVTNNQGITSTFSWDWLKLRVLYHTTDVYSEFEFGEDLLLSDISVTFLGAAAMIDYGNFMWRSEYTSAEREGDDLLGDASSWYASVGYSFDKLTPHFTHSVNEPGGDSETTTDTVGLAWYFDSSAVLKLEYSQNESTGTFFGIATPDTEVISVAVDLVF